MTALPMDVMLEVIVCVLLAATIVYCATLDRRLRAMRSGQDGLRELITDLSAATNNAVAAIARLREASDATGKSLSEQVKRGRALADELALMVESGNDIADRLGSLEMRRPASAPVAQPAAGPRIVQPSRDTKPLSAEPQRLLDLLKRAR
ncbi:MAG: DUF6468 domain-containing protein [Parvibaculum sp.]|jgi:hypothetical protein|uniref:DUF6468 domain-containing protein n=1 Tax=Parvibaculum sp. TaxID=2024848 RepID=UPI00284158AB|nr:DUF6468 domain-containing protein [Parvibaculum sp.]MDR3500576.1 DUF6468 domain-containing protein [Parvibaculum sp.]